MSKYIFYHPREAYLDEKKTLIKAFKRREVPAFIRWLILERRRAAYIFRRIRLEDATDY